MNTKPSPEWIDRLILRAKIALPANTPFKAEMHNNSYWKHLNMVRSVEPDFSSRLHYGNMPISSIEMVGFNPPCPFMGNKHSASFRALQFARRVIDDGWYPLLSVRLRDTKKGYLISIDYPPQVPSERWKEAYDLSVSATTALWDGMANHADLILTDDLFAEVYKPRANRENHPYHRIRSTDSVDDDMPGPHT